MNTPQGTLLPIDCCRSKPLQWHWLMTCMACGCADGMSAVGLIMLRRSQPTLARPFRVPLYPATPVAAALLSLMVVVGAVVDAPAPSLAALAFIGLSFPVYHWVYRHRVEAYNAATASTTLAGAGAVTAAGAAQHGSQEVELRATAYVRAPAATST